MSTAPSAGPQPLWRELATTRFLGVAVLAAAAYLIVVAVPTAIIANPFFRRMTAPTIWSWIFWIAPALVFGPLCASYIVNGPWRACPRPGRQTLAGGFLSFLAVGCPICNKVVVAVLGVSGALSYFAPIQPLLGTISVALLGFSLWLRFRPVSATASMTQRLGGLCLGGHVGTTCPAGILPFRDGRAIRVE